jgi:GGDEF domain-containing protein
MLFEGLDSPGGAEYVAGKIHAALTQPVTLLSEADKADVAVRIGASIGVAVYPDHAVDPEELVMLADMAMYEVKRAGGGVRVHGGRNLEPAAAVAHLQLVRARGERKGSER